MERTDPGTAWHCDCEQSSQLESFRVPASLRLASAINGRAVLQHVLKNGANTERVKKTRSKLLVFSNTCLKKGWKLQVQVAEAEVRFGPAIPCSLTVSIHLNLCIVAMLKKISGI